MDNFKSTDGSQIKYKVVGEGKPIVFIHGWSIDYRLWFNKIESIDGDWKKRYKRIYFDLPGMGKSIGAKTIKNSDDMLRNIEELLDYILKGQKYILAGESYGGYLSRGLLLKHYQKIDGLFLLCPLIFPGWRKGIVPNKQVLEKDDDFLKQLSKEDREGFEYLSIVQNKKMWLEYKNDIHMEINNENKGFLENQLDGSFSYDINEIDIEYDRPMLVLLGRQDTEVGFEDQYNLYKNYSRATIQIIDKAGHNLQIESREMFCAAFLDLLARIETYKG